MSGEVGGFEADDIRKQVRRLLRDLGNPEPPIDLAQVREQLQLDRRYYSTADHSTFDEVAHRVKVGGKQVVNTLIGLITKSKLCAFWLPERRRILIDEATPQKKHRWIEAHEIGHSITPWHQEFLFGDNEYTLDPACHAMVEAEANYAAAQLLFLQERFAADARDVEPIFKNIQALSKRYGNTLTSTLWRMVEEREPDRPVFGMVSAHPRHPTIGAQKGGRPVRHFVRSRAFRKRFPHMSAEDGFAILQVHAGWTKRGTIVSVDHPIIDVHGELCEFHVESLSTPYYVLTYGAFNGCLPTLFVVP
jgi:Zn-dependent peptidase ImmA (M78 family)